MKRILIFLISCLSFIAIEAQTMDCSKFCVINISLDLLTGVMLVTIYNGDSAHVNYPTVQVIDVNGDTIGNPDGLFSLFAHPAGDTIVHSIPTSIPFLPLGFTGTVLFTDPLWNNTCTFSYPMSCFIGQSPPDCDDLTVEDIQIDTIAGTMDVTLFNSCTNCASGLSGPVYCEMKVITTVPPYDTLAESNCYCFITPNNLSYNFYTLTSYVNTIPSINDIKVIFNCGSGLCDTLQINPALGVAENLLTNHTNIFPNPTTGFFTIDFSTGAPAGECKMEIFDITGRIIYQTILPQINMPHTINLPLNIGNGLYNCILKWDREWITKKIVVVTP